MVEGDGDWSQDLNNDGEDQVADKNALSNVSEMHTESLSESSQKIHGRSTLRSRAQTLGRLGRFSSTVLTARNQSSAAKRQTRQKSRHKSDNATNTDKPPLHLLVGSWVA